MAVLKKTNEYYAIAKYAGIKLCESYNKQFKKNLFLSIIPPNLFGIRDNFHASDSHVLTALLRKFYIAKKFSKKKLKFGVLEILRGNSCMQMMQHI